MGPGSTSIPKDDIHIHGTFTLVRCIFLGNFSNLWRWITVSGARKWNHGNGSCWLSKPSKFHRCPAYFLLLIQHPTKEGNWIRIRIGVIYPQRTQPQFAYIRRLRLSGALSRLSVERNTDSNRRGPLVLSVVYFKLHARTDQQWTLTKDLLLIINWGWMHECPNKSKHEQLENHLKIAKTEVSEIGRASCRERV